MPPSDTWSASLNPPAISVVMPAYQAAATIESAIQSVLDQTWQDFELLVINDGSTDATAAVVSAFVDPRVRLIEQENQGPSAARNQGIDAARAPMIAFLDADDRWLPERLSAQLADIQTVDLVYSDAFELLPDGRTRRYHERVPPVPAHEPDMLRWLVTQPNPIPLLTVLVRRERLCEVGGFDRSLLGGEDLDLWVRLAAAGCSFRRLDRPMAEYVVSTTGLSANRPRMLDHEARAFEKLAQNLPKRIRRAARVRSRKLRAEAAVARRRKDESAAARWRSVPVVLAGGRIQQSLGQILYAMSPKALAAVRATAMSHEQPDERLRAPTTGRK